MTQLTADDHQGGVAVREGTIDPDSASDLPILAFDDATCMNLLLIDTGTILCVPLSTIHEWAVARVIKYHGEAALFCR